MINNPSAYSGIFLVLFPRPCLWEFLACAGKRAVWCWGCLVCRSSPSRYRHHPVFIRPRAPVCCWFQSPALSLSPQANRFSTTASCTRLGCWSIGSHWLSPRKNFLTTTLNHWLCVWDLLSSHHTYFWSVFNLVFSIFCDFMNVILSAFYSSVILKNSMISDGWKKQQSSFLLWVGFMHS